jgi:hypothetical protein
MTEQALHLARNKDLAGSLVAMKRVARGLAIQINAAIILAKNGVMTRVTAEELGQEDLRNAQTQPNPEPSQYP